MYTTDVSGFANIEESLTIGRMHSNCRRISVFHLLKTHIPLIFNSRHIYVFHLLMAPICICSNCRRMCVFYRQWRQYLSGTGFALTPDGMTVDVSTHTGTLFELRSRQEGFNGTLLELHAVGRYSDDDDE